MNRYLRKCRSLNIRNNSIFSVLKQVSLFIHTSENRYHININDEETAERLKDIKHAFDLRDPGQFFSEARSMQREIVFHAGPTNSGKTHQAIQRYLQARTAIYCGPLRMLAGEIFRRTNEQATHRIKCSDQSRVNKRVIDCFEHLHEENTKLSANNIPCDLVTGEERIYAVSKEQPANHVACTVELCSIIQHYEVAVIDEIQMLRDYDRGWAWTRALLGVPARELHICGEESALGIIKKLLAKTTDTLKVKRYHRLTPLKTMKSSLDLLSLQKGDCLIAFSQKKIFNLRLVVERATKLKCAVIYGNLPSNVRFGQARQFNDGLCDVLIASDAIGMGLNLNIRRIIFSSLNKFDGYEYTTLAPYHLKQIAGRAGRYGSRYEQGLVTALHPDMMEKLRELMQVNIKPIRKAGILPTYEQLELLSIAIPGKSLLELLEVFELLMELDQNYFLCDVDRLKIVAQKIEDIPLTLHQSFLFSVAPMNIIKSAFVSFCMKKFAWSVSTDTPVTVNYVKRIVGWPPRSFPRTLKQLQDLEYVHEVLDLYRWLSYRFPEVFIQLNEIVALQEKLEKVISRAVDANLKNYGFYQKNVGQFVAKRKKRKR